MPPPPKTDGEKAWEMYSDNLREEIIQSRKENQELKKNLIWMYLELYLTFAVFLGIMIYANNVLEQIITKMHK